jgi:DNA-binding IclR family transcriptional regulator
VSREEALREVARAFLHGAGMTLRGELAKVTGLSRTDAGLGNHALVKEGYAERIANGVYKLSMNAERGTMK